MLKNPHALIRGGLLSGLILLAGCAGPALSPRLHALPETVELAGVPFFQQRSYQSAPASLASLLTFQGEVITPGLLERPLHLPGDESDLRQRMRDEAVRHGLLVYPLQPNLDDLFVQVAAGNPVLVHLNEGWMAANRFALLIGYDRIKRIVWLRAGAERRLPMSFSKFASAWSDAGHWAVLVQSPAKVPADVDRQIWLQGADALERAGQGDAAAVARRQLGD
nr:hypothetical protein [Pseudomonas sp. RIT-PI-AD]